MFAIITNDYRSNREHVKRRKSEIVDKNENKLLVIFKSQDGNAMMMMIERKRCEPRFTRMKERERERAQERKTEKGKERKREKARKQKRKRVIKKVVTWSVEWPNSSVLTSPG